MTLALASRRTALTPPWVRDDLWRRARAVPSLDLRFADNKSLTDAVTGASLVTFTRASSGTFVDSAGVLQTAATDVPRFDHNPITGESLGLLVEEQRTNLLLRSEEFGTTWTAPGFSAVTPNTTVAPNGVTTADTLVETTGVSEVHRVSQTISVVSGTTYTLSVFAKQGSRQYVYLGFGPNATWNGTGVNGFFDLQNGTIGTLVNCTATIVAYPNGWYRCTVTSTPTATNANAIANIGASSNGTTQTYTGDGSNAVILWGAQLEAGAFPTSYIPTTTAAVTRSADVASITGSAFSGWYNAAEGTVFVDGAQNSVTSANVGFVSINDASSSNRFEIRQSRLNPTLTSSGTNATAYVNGSPAPASGHKTNVFYKQAVAFGGSSHANYAFNGSQTSTTTLSSINANRLILGARDGQAAPTGGASLTVSRLAFWPQRLANSTLQQITQ